MSDCFALRGDSGAPIITADADGNFHVVGVQTAIVQIGRGYQSIAVAVPKFPGCVDAVNPSLSLRGRCHLHRERDCFELDRSSFWEA